MRNNYFLVGIRSAIPIVLGYLPVALTFGISGAGLGISLPELSLISLIVYSGAGQFMILKMYGALSSMVLLVTLLNARHLFYGPILSHVLPPSTKQRLLMAFFLTDEVFATAFLKLKEVPPAGRFAWYMGVGVTAWLSWQIGTVTGVVLGDQLLQHFPLLKNVLVFALPSLFVTLTVLCINKSMALALIISSVVCLVVFFYSQQSSYAIFAGALSALLCYRPAPQPAAVTLQDEASALQGDER
ncbi:AzlC family ABC transporter permease [Brackiella oedipodis]|uniref:AzlC family ABC transporter permease n=1 Tax=Brackiella oedipodis TaxID=124225 RepID=UPI0009FC696C|nr:AzlC family ABC transporter permease [Brackiella oedipodis]